MDRILIIPGQDLLDGLETLERDGVKGGGSVGEERESNGCTQATLSSLTSRVPQAVFAKNDMCKPFVLFSHARGSEDDTCQVIGQEMIIDDEQIAQEVGHDAHGCSYPICWSVNREHGADPIFLRPCPKWLFQVGHLLIHVPKKGNASTWRGMPQMVDILKWLCETSEYLG